MCLLLDLDAYHNLKNEGNTLRTKLKFITEDVEWGNTLK